MSSAFSGNDWHDYAVKWIEDQMGRKVTGTYLQDSPNGIQTDTWPTDPDQVSIIHRDEFGNFFVLNINTKRDTSKQMGCCARYTVLLESNQSDKYLLCSLR